MSKLTKALFSFSAKGRLGKALSFRRKGSQTIAEKMPIPEDTKSLAQLSWRHMYQKAVALWHLLSPEEKEDWESKARTRHMTGFAWFMSQCLKPNPGIYLPLQGGTMSGDIDMAKHRILKLPEPEDDQEAATKEYVDAAGPAVHGPEMHNDITRELFMSAALGHPDGMIASVWSARWPMYKAPDGVTSVLYFGMKVPDDFVSFTSLKLVWMAAPETGNMVWRIRCHYAASGEGYWTHEQSPAMGVTATDGYKIVNVQEPQYPITSPNGTLGDHLGIAIYRYGTDDFDTLDDDAYIIGLLYTYTANQ